MTEETKKIIDEKIEKISKYKKGDKFVVEIMESGYPYSAVSESRNCSEEFLDSLDRLDSDYINEHFGALQDEAYNKGLEDAWKLLHDCMFVRTVRDNDAIFEFEYTEDIIKHLTPQEALAKMKAYEESQEIKVGDVIRVKEIESNVEILVTKLYPEDETFDGFKIMPKSEFGGTFYDREIESYERTGKHINIQQILEQIGGE